MALCACRGPEVTTRNGDGAAGGPPDSFAFRPAEAGGDQPGPASCAFQAFAAERLPLDLVVLVDASGSMAEPVAGGSRTKWQMAQEALAAFVRDPASAGLGVGLQFFPLAGPGTPCQSAADCGFADAGPAGACQQRQACVTPGQPPGLVCSGGASCGGNGTCQPLGTCAATGNACATVGTACPGGVAGDVCRFEPFTCHQTQAACTADRYSRLAADVAELPAAAPGLVRLLAMRGAGGLTPMAEGVIGTLTHLRARLVAMPRRRAALVLATDGLPSGCSDRDIPLVGDAIFAARNGSPGVPTHVIGVLDDAALAEGRAALGELAAAGGSGAPVILSPAGDLTHKLLAALSQIRGDALPCEYTIPRDRAGAIDFDRVNVHLSVAAAPSVDEDIPYVGEAARCHASRGGWHYDVDPATGAPTRIITCPATCTRIKSLPDAKVDLRFGCKTVVIP